jgi:xanthine dehydrogenase YagS FAD-binding subunit
MRPFDFHRADSDDSAMQAFMTPRTLATDGSSQYLAGGTTLLDLMKLDVTRPGRLIDINHLAEGRMGRIELSSQGLFLGAMARMAEVADHADVRSHFPVIAQSLQLAASAQIRNMASLGGNVLQRTRCSYFRDVSYANCNKREPGSGCAAMEGLNRSHAILGSSEQCIATYPGDFAQALIALDAGVEVADAHGKRMIPFAELHVPPRTTPYIETTLAPGDLITGFYIPATVFARRSLYLKIRDRESYEFALASAAVALDVRGGTVSAARIALGGLATVPWRAREAEAALLNQPANEQAFQLAADAAFRDAAPRDHNAFKVDLGKRTLVRALQQAAAMEI